MNSAKTIEKDLKTLRAKMSDQDVLSKSLEAKLVELQAKGCRLLSTYISFQFIILKTTDVMSVLLSRPIG